MNVWELCVWSGKWAYVGTDVCRLGMGIWGMGMEKNDSFFSLR